MSFRIGADLRLLPFWCGRQGLNPQLGGILRICFTFACNTPYYRGMLHEIETLNAVLNFASALLLLLASLNSIILKKS